MLDLGCSSCWASSKAGGYLSLWPSTQAGCHGWNHFARSLSLSQSLSSSPTPEFAFLLSCSLSFPYKRPIIHHLVQFIYIRDEENETPNYHVTWSYWFARPRKESSTRKIPETLSWIKTCKELHHQLGAPRDQGLNLANCAKVVGITALSWFFGRRKLNLMKCDTVPLKSSLGP